MLQHEIPARVAVLEQRAIDLADDVKSIREGVSTIKEIVDAIRLSQAKTAGRAEVSSTVGKGLGAVALTLWTALVGGISAWLIPHGH